MADIESRVDNLEEKYSNLHTAVNVMAAKVDAVSEKIDLVVGEMRQQNLLRAKEISEIGKKLEKAQEKHNEDMKAINATTDAKISKIESNIDSMTKHIQILSLTAMGGIIAAGVGIAAMIWSVINK